MTEAKKCKCKCSEFWVREYYAEYDTWGCKTCDSWVKRGYANEPYKYCKDRPDKPSEVKDEKHR